MNKFYLKNQLIAKNTQEIARILADEFIRLYGEKWGKRAEILQCLMPRGKATTWSGLDRNINHFCKQFYKEWQEHENKVAFLDEARFALAALPMKQDYKLDESKPQYSKPEYIAQFFETCSLCWRSVLKRPLEKKTPLCHLHDLPSAHPEYRKRARTKKQMEALRLHLLKSLPPLIHLKKELGTELNDYTKTLCLNREGPLKHLTSYLYSLNMPLNSGQDILQALEYPIYQKQLSKPILQAWTLHLEDRGKHFKLNYIKLLTAYQPIRKRKSQDDY